MDQQKTIKEVKIQAEQILNSGKLTKGNIHHIKMLFSKFYRISIRWKEFTAFEENISKAVIESIHNSVKMAKINRKSTTQKLREKLQNE